MDQTNATDVIVIGAGPIGLEVAIALRNEGLDVLQFDAGQVGQTIYDFPRSTKFFSSPERIALAGLPIQTTDQSKCTREEYLAYLRTLVMMHQLDIRTYEPVIHINRFEDDCADEARFTVTTRAANATHQYRCQHLVIATGGTADHRVLDIEGEDLPHVSHHLDDPHRYFQKRVLIVGGRNSAVEAALRCYHAGAHVMVSYRKDAFPERVKYWLKPEIETLLKRGHIEVIFNSHPVEISPTYVTLAHDDSEETMFIPTDFVLLMIGYEADMSVFDMAGVTLQPPRQSPSYDQQTMETDVPGVFVAGTAIAGTQHGFAVYLENCHIHADRIAAAIIGHDPPPERMKYELPET